jgi:hypothetical protein
VAPGSKERYWGNSASWTARSTNTCSTPQVTRRVWEGAETNRPTVTAVTTAYRRNQHASFNSTLPCFVLIASPGGPGASSSPAGPAAPASWPSP